MALRCSAPSPITANTDYTLDIVDVSTTVSDCTNPLAHSSSRSMFGHFAERATLTHHVQPSQTRNDWNLHPKEKGPTSLDGKFLRFVSLGGREGTLGTGHHHLGILLQAHHGLRNLGSHSGDVDVGKWRQLSLQDLAVFSDSQSPRREG